MKKKIFSETFPATPSLPQDVPKTYSLLQGTRFTCVTERFSIDWLTWCIYYHYVLEYITKTLHHANSFQTWWFVLWGFTNNLPQKA